MHRLLSRTSITEDEAVSILLGHTTGPIEFEVIEGDEEAEANCPTFYLRETLEDELDVLDGEYRLAKYDNQSERVIAEKLAALQRQEAIMERANVYLCAIRDELNKGERSALRVDSALSNAAYTYITLHSFNEWMKATGRELTGEQPGAVEASVASVAPMKGATKRPPRIKLLQQGDAILAELQQQGIDPMALPRNPSGKPGVKAAVCASLEKSPLFKGSTIFDKAWQRLRKEGLIVDKAGPSSPQIVDGGDL